MWCEYANAPCADPEADCADGQCYLEKSFMEDFMCETYGRPCMRIDYCYGVNDGIRCARAQIDDLPINLAFTQRYDYGTDKDIPNDDNDQLNYRVDPKRKLGPGNSN